MRRHKYNITIRQKMLIDELLRMKDENVEYFTTADIEKFFIQHKLARPDDKYLRDLCLTSLKSAKLHLNEMGIHFRDSGRESETRRIKFIFIDRGIKDDK